jgi:hypothetical protein
MFTAIWAYLSTIVAHAEVGLGQDHNIVTGGFVFLYTLPIIRSLSP